MEIRYRNRFMKEYFALPNDLKQILKLKEQVFRLNPYDIKLKTHKLHGPLEGFMAFSLNSKYRVIFSFCDEDSSIVEFLSVGNHDIYEK